MSIALTAALIAAPASAARAAAKGLTSSAKRLRPPPHGEDGEPGGAFAAPDGFPDAVFAADEQGRWRRWSHGELPGCEDRPCDDPTAWISTHVHLHDRVGALRAISECQNASRSATIQMRLVAAQADAPAADERWFELVCVPQQGRGGSPLTPVLAIVRDITAHKQAEAGLRAQLDDAHRASASKTRFLANMSHELRTPLNAIIGFSDILRSRAVPPGAEHKRAEYYDLIHQSGMHLLEVVNQILDVSKIEADKYDIRPEPTDVGALLASCVAMFGAQASQKGVDLAFEPAPDVPQIMADPGALRQVVINLIANAIKFTDSGGRVRAKLGRGEAGVEIAVADDGIGIAAQDIPVLCNPFFQAGGPNERCSEGLGLGLSIVVGLVDLHGGAMAIESEPGVGTTVRVTLPAAPAPARPVPGEDIATVVALPATPEDRQAGSLARASRAG